MSQIVRNVNSVNIHSFEPGHKPVPVDLNAAQSDQLKQNLKPLFNALIQHDLFKKTFKEQLSSSSSEIPLNISLTENIITVTNKETHKTSRFSVDQTPENAPLNALIARIFEIAQCALPIQEAPKTIIKQPIPQPDLLDVSQLTDPIPLETSHPATKPSTLQSILNLYDAPAALTPSLPNPHSRKSPVHLTNNGTSPSHRPYLEDRFYDLPNTPHKKPEREIPKKHTALSDIDAFEYLKELERLENQKKLAIQADLSIASILEF